MTLRPALAYARLEFRRGLRNRSYLVFSLAFPVLAYLLHAGFDNADAWRAHGLPASVQFMVSMAAFGVILNALSVGPRIAREREVGWTRQLRITPLRAADVVLAKVAVATLLALPVIVLVFAAAAGVNGVALPLPRWGAMTGLLWLASAPFAALAVAVGYLTDADTANVANSGLMLALAFLGGLFVPLQAMPGPVAAVGWVLPSHAYAEAAWSVAAHGGIDVAALALVAAWAVLFGAGAVAAYRRASDAP